MQKGDRVRLTTLTFNKQIVGFELGMEGKVVEICPRGYFNIRWDKCPKGVSNPVSTHGDSLSLV